MTAILVGVDSGGTRTNVELAVDGEPHPRATYEVADSLSGALDPAMYQSCLRAILSPLASYTDVAGIDQASIYVFISAAAFTPWVRGDLVRAVREVCPHILNGRIAAVGIANDAVSLLLGLNADGVIIAGTGSSVLLHSPDGDLYQVGGREWVVSDQGSGFWIGLRAIRRAYRDFEAGENSVLLQRLRQLYGIRPDDDDRLLARLRDLSIAEANMKKEIARFAATVCAAAERGDQGAQDIVKAEAEGLADMTATGLRRRFKSTELLDGLDLVQCGSVLGNEFFRSRFEAQVEMRLRSDSGRRAELRWRRVLTAGEAAINLARGLRGSSEALLALDNLYRPALVRLSEQAVD